MKKIKPLWDRLCDIEVNRTSPCGLYKGAIEPGVNYFVLMLEQLGAVTHYACEGHPNGFYVSFKAPLKIAEKIAVCGFFSVVLEGKSKWSIRTRQLDSDEERIQLLRWAAESWERELGPLKIRKGKRSCHASSSTKASLV